MLDQLIAGFDMVDESLKTNVSNKVAQAFLPVKGDEQTGMSATPCEGLPSDAQTGMSATPSKAGQA